MDVHHHTAPPCFSYHSTDCVLVLNAASLVEPPKVLDFVRLLDKIFTVSNVVNGLNANIFVIKI